MRDNGQRRLSERAQMTDAEALTTLLTVEAFLIAVLTLTATLVAPGQSRVPALPVSGFKLAMSAAIAVCVVAVGAVCAWAGMYVGGSLRPAREVAVAAILLLAVLFHPIFAVVLALGVRSKR
ncbi:hypothetical protein [Mycobacterium avium]